MEAERSHRQKAEKQKRDLSEELEALKTELMEAEDKGLGKGSKKELHTASLGVHYIGMVY